MGIINSLLGFGYTPLDSYIGRNKPKAGEKWCSLCGGKGVVGIIDALPCPKCKGSGRVTKSKTINNNKINDTNTKTETVVEKKKSTTGSSLMIIGITIGGFIGFTIGIQGFGNNTTTDPFLFAGILGAIGAASLPLLFILLAVTFKIIRFLAVPALLVIVVMAVLNNI